MDDDAPEKLWRLFGGFVNFEQSEKSRHDKWKTLDRVMCIIDHGLRFAASGLQAETLFSNDVAAASCLFRSYQSLQAGAMLAATGYYADARAVIRGAYEAGGLARMLAHDVDLAEKWLRKSEWVPDRKSRDYTLALSGGDEDAKIPYQQYYKRASAFAHPAAASSLPFVFDADATINPKLYPEFNGEMLDVVVMELTAQAIFIGYCLRNAMARPEILEPQWHRDLAEIAREFSGLPMEHLDADWDERERQYQELKKSVRPKEEIDEFLRNHPNSIDKIFKRAEEANDESDE